MVPRSSARPRGRTPGVVAVAIGLGVVIAGLVVATVAPVQTASFGWFAYQPLAASPSAAWFFSISAYGWIAIACLALGMLAVGAGIGWLLARR